MLSFLFGTLVGAVAMLVLYSSLFSLVPDKGADGYILNINDVTYQVQKVQIKQPEK